MRSIFSFLPVGDTLVVDRLGSQGLFFCPGLHSQTVLADAGATATAHMAVAATRAARTDLRTGVSSTSGGKLANESNGATDRRNVSAESRLLPPREDLGEPVAHPVGELGRALLQKRGDALAGVGGLAARHHRPRVRAMRL